MMKVVGVIGAGAGGLCAARHISATPGMTAVVWEKAARVGGTWVYTPQVGKDEHGLPVFSSMYKNLKTNLPKEVMEFPDFPFRAQKESYLHHTDILRYLEDYARHYDLHQHIKFGCHVEEVKPVEHDEQPTSWSVTVRDLETSTMTTTVCDAVLVCSGHYSVPKTPLIKDIEKFRGRQLHSHDYREPEPFKGLRVVMLGAGTSGVDISLEVAAVAKEVILSHNLPVQIPSELPNNLRQTRGIVAAYEDGFIFGDGSRVEADAIVYCTGYEYTFPFLSEKCGVTVEDNIVKPLYKHLINIAHPSMAFVGIPFMVAPFPLFDFQEWDMSIVLVGVSHTRYQVMDFTGPLYMDDTSVAYARPFPKADVAGFIKPYTPMMWAMLLLSSVLVTGVTLLVQLSNHTQDDREERVGDSDGRRRAQQVGVLVMLYRAIQWVLCCLLTQSATWQPRKVSVRLVGGFWLLASIIVASVYRSNLKAMLILPRTPLPFNSFRELSQTDITAFVIKGSLFDHALKAAAPHSLLGQLHDQAIVGSDLNFATNACINSEMACFGSRIGLWNLVARTSATHHQVAGVWHHAVAVRHGSGQGLALPRVHQRHGLCQGRNPAATGAAGLLRRVCCLRRRHLAGAGDVPGGGCGVSCGPRTAGVSPS